MIISRNLSFSWGNVMQHIERQGRWCCLKWRSNSEDLSITRSCTCGGNIYKAGKQDYKRLVILKDQKVSLQHACHLREYLHNTRNRKNIIQRMDARRYSEVLANCKWAPEEWDSVRRTKILHLVAHGMSVQSQLEKAPNQKQTPFPWISGGRLFSCRWKK